MSLKKFETISLSLYVEHKPQQNRQTNVVVMSLGWK